MGNKHIIGEFTPKEDTAEYFQIRKERVLEQINKTIYDIGQINNQMLQATSIFSMIDAMAQEASNYPTDKKQADIFAEFVLNHQHSFPYLSETDPITMFYHVENEINPEILPKDYPIRKNRTLYRGRNDKNSVIIELKNVLPSKDVATIITSLEQKMGIQYATKKIKEHQVIQLLYRMRSKSTHEMTSLGMSEPFFDEYEIEEPYYHQESRIFPINGQVEKEEVVTLHFPNLFLLKLLKECTQSYIDECEVKNRIPFDNAKLSRRHYLTWYDK